MMATNETTSTPADLPVTTGARFSVLYMRDGREVRTAWFSRRDRAERARSVIAQRYGAAIVYVD